MPLDYGQSAVAELPLEAIRVEGRFRRELRDIDSLATSISEVGLLHPVIVTPAPEYRLIAGERRLHAMRKLGRTHVPVRVVPLADIVRGEFAENVNRKDFTPSEMVAIGRAVEPLVRAQAKERKREGGRRGGKASGKSGSFERRCSRPRRSLLRHLRAHLREGERGRYGRRA